MDKKLVGERIKKIRQKLGESQEEFGKRFNPPVSKAAVSRWEKGTAKPEDERLKAIAKRGNVSVDYLIYGTSAERFVKALKEIGLQGKVEGYTNKEGRYIKIKGKCGLYLSRRDFFKCSPYNGKVNVENGQLSVPVLRDWYKLYYTYITNGTDSTEGSYTRGDGDNYEVFASVPDTVDKVRVVLQDYAGNLSEAVTIDNRPAVILTSETTMVNTGDTLQLSAEVKRSEKGNAVKWSVSDNTSTDTTIDENGLLTVGDNETAFLLRITATSLEAPDVSGTMYIMVADAYNLTPQYVSVNYGGTQKFSIEKPSGKQAPADAFIWSIESVSGDITSVNTKISEDGLFTAGIDETSREIKVMATDKKSQFVHSTIIYLRSNNSIPNAVSSIEQFADIQTDSETFSVEKSLVKNKAEAPVPAPAPTNNDPAVPDEVVWTVEGANSADTKVDENGTLTIGIDETAVQLYVTATSVVDETKSDTAVVNVTPKEKHYVEVIAGEHGTVTPGSGEYYEGTDVTFTFVPEEGYAVDKVTVDGKEVSLTDGKYTLTVTGTTQIEASFKVSPDAPDTGDYMPVMVLLLFAVSAVLLASGCYLFVCRRRK